MYFYIKRPKEQKDKKVIKISTTHLKMQLKTFKCCTKASFEMYTTKHIYFTVTHK